jgi:hypothetical protein
LTIDLEMDKDKYSLQSFAYKLRDACLPEDAEPEAGGSGQPQVLRAICEQDSTLQHNTEALVK